jgi:hypothetical protein
MSSELSVGTGSTIPNSRGEALGCAWRIGGINLERMQKMACCRIRSRAVEAAEDRQSRGHCLLHDQRKSFAHGRKQESVSGTVKLGQLLATPAAEQVHVGKSPASGIAWPRADEVEIPFGLRGGHRANRSKALFLDEAPDEENLTALIGHVELPTQTRPFAMLRQSEKLVVDAIEQQGRRSRPFGSAE